MRTIIIKSWQDQHENWWNHKTKNQTGKGGHISWTLVAIFSWYQLGQQGWYVHERTFGRNGDRTLPTDDSLLSFVTGVEWWRIIYASSSCLLSCTLCGSSDLVDLQEVQIAFFTATENQTHQIISTQQRWNQQYHLNQYVQASIHRENKFSQRAEREFRQCKVTNLEQWIISRRIAAFFIL